MVEGYFTLGSESGFWLFIIFCVVLGLGFFGDCKMCLQGFMRYPPTVGEVELWNGFFPWSEAAVGFREGKNSGSFSFPQIHKQTQEE